jgi:hypothetical protein
MYRASRHRIRLNTLQVNALQESQKGCALILRKFSEHSIFALPYEHLGFLEQLLASRR